MKKMYLKGLAKLSIVKNKLKSEKGQGMTEYGLIIGLIAVVVIIILATMGDSIKAKFQEIIDALT